MKSWTNKIINIIIQEWCQQNLKLEFNKNSTILDLLLSNPTNYVEILERVLGLLIGIFFIFRTWTQDTWLRVKTSSYFYQLHVSTSFEK